MPRNASIPSLFAGVTLVALLLVLLLAAAAAPGVSAFRFTVVPGRSKCFTYEVMEAGRYELRYRMARSLTPFVSFSVNSPGGRVLLEHEIAKADAKEIVAVRSPGALGLCFNTEPRAAVAAVSLNVTLNIADAEDAELTRNKRQQYSTSSAIALGAGKGSKVIRQHRYIEQLLNRMHVANTAMMQLDDDMRFSFAETRAWMWKMLYLFIGVGVATVVGLYVRVQLYFARHRARARARRAAAGAPHPQQPPPLKQEGFSTRVAMKTA